MNAKAQYVLAVAVTALCLWLALADAFFHRPKPSTKYYDLFEMDPQNFDKTALRKAYYRLAKKYHPDKNPNNAEAAEKFREVTQAFEVLNDDSKRSQYDAYGDEGLGQGGFQSDGAGFNAQDIFERFFGRQGGRGHDFFNQGGDRRARTPDFKVQYSMGLEEIYTGAAVSIEIPRQKICSACDGAGAKNPSDVKVCAECHGHGMKIVQKMLAPGFIQQMQTVCPRCNGQGRTYTRPCASCHGDKVRKETETLHVQVPAGAPENFVLKLEEMADELPEHTSGDVYVVITSEPHERFRRDGHDLHTTLELSLYEALYGFTRTITHLDGRPVELARRRVTQPEFVAEIRGQGMPIVSETGRDTGQRGRLFVRCIVLLPESPPEGAFRRDVEKHSRPILDHDEL